VERMGVHVKCPLRLSDLRGSEKVYKSPISDFIQICSSTLILLKFGQTVSKMRGAGWQRFIPYALSMEDDCSLAAAGQWRHRLWLLVHDTV
jgi:hypothetical protein